MLHEGVAAGEANQDRGALTLGRPVSQRFQPSCSDTGAGLNLPRESSVTTETVVETQGGKGRPNITVAKAKCSYFNDQLSPVRLGHRMG